MATARRGLRKQLRDHTNNVNATISLSRENPDKSSSNSPHKNGVPSPSLPYKTLVRSSESLDSNSNSDREISGLDETDRLAAAGLRDNFGTSLTNCDFDASCASPIQEEYFSQQTNCDSAKKKNLRKSVEERETSKRKEIIGLPSNDFFKNYRGTHLTGGPTPMILIALAIFVILFILYFGLSSEKTKPIFESKSKSMEKVHSEMKSGLKVLSRDMQQSRHLWTQVLSEINNLVEESPQQPSVLLAIVPLDSQKTATCFTQLLADIVSSAFEDSKAIMFDVKSSLRQDINSLKHDLDRSLKGLENSHMAVIHNIEKLPPQATTIFHGYCDNENAPFKRALIILTVVTELNYDSLVVDRLDSTINHYFEQLWEGSLRDVDAAAIVSRIGNSPILIKPESSDVIQKLCPL